MQCHYKQYIKEHYIKFSICKVVQVRNDVRSNCTAAYGDDVCVNTGRLPVMISNETMYHPCVYSISLYSDVVLDKLTHARHLISDVVFGKLTHYRPNWRVCPDARISVLIVYSNIKASALLAEVSQISSQNAFNNKTCLQRSIYDALDYIVSYVYACLIAIKLQCLWYWTINR